jgi:hypothetical protein
VAESKLKNQGNVLRQASEPSFCWHGERKGWTHRCKQKQAEASPLVLGLENANIIRLRHQLDQGGKQILLPVARETRDTWDYDNLPTLS